jgi:rare lipoprotein A (peptidoglycan hydrolase)
MVKCFINKNIFWYDTNIIIWIHVILLILFMGSCRNHFIISEAKTLEDSVRVYNDTTQYKTIFLKNGRASWYGKEWNGLCTQCGDTFQTYKYTAASATIPIGTFLKITNLKNGKVIFVKVNDTFPKWNRRDLDISEGAAERIGMIDEGVGRVRIEIIKEVKRN